MNSYFLRLSQNLVSTIQSLKVFYINLLDNWNKMRHN